MTVELPPEIEKLVEEKMRIRGYASVEELVVAALLAFPADDDEFEDFGAPEELEVRSLEQLKKMIFEGQAETSARVYTDADFARIRHELMTTGRISPR